MAEEKEIQPKSADSPPERRNFLKGALAFAVVLLVAGVGGVARALKAPNVPLPSGSSTTTTESSFPKIKVANISNVVLNQPIQFNYPLQEEPNMLIKLGVKATGGIGPDGDIVAYSMICQHLGCIYGYVPEGEHAACAPSYNAPSPVGYCCCHGSIYDLVNGAKVLGGPAPRPVPQVTLELDSSSGDIYATGMSPPTVFGHDTGSNDITADLQGGTPVS